MVKTGTDTITLKNSQYRKTDDAESLGLQGFSSWCPPLRTDGPCISGDMTEDVPSMIVYNGKNME